MMMMMMMMMICVCVCLLVVVVVVIVVVVVVVVVVVFMVLYVHRNHKAYSGRVDNDQNDHFYTALFSALQLTHYAFRRFDIRQSGVLTVTALFSCYMAGAT